MVEQWPFKPLVGVQSLHAHSGDIMGVIGCGRVALLFGVSGMRRNIATTGLTLAVGLAGGGLDGHGQDPSGGVRRGGGAGQSAQRPWHRVPGRGRDRARTRYSWPGTAWCPGCALDDATTAARPGPRRYRDRRSGGVPPVDGFDPVGTSTTAISPTAARHRRRPHALAPTTPTAAGPVATTPATRTCASALVEYPAITEVRRGQLSRRGAAFAGAWCAWSCRIPVRPAGFAADREIAGDPAGADDQRHQFGYPTSRPPRRPSRSTARREWRGGRGGELATGRPCTSTCRRAAPYTDQFDGIVLDLSTGVRSRSTTAWQRHEPDQDPDPGHYFNVTTGR